MNIFHKTALQSLLKNRTRTLVTVIGAALSAALFTGVVTFAVSLQQYMVRGAEGIYGNWHLEVFDTDAAFEEELSQDSKVSAVSSFENIGYALLDGGQNPDKPYLFLAGFRDSTFAVLPPYLLEGRLPENGSEVLVPSHVEANGGVRFAAGDTLTLSVGERQSDGAVLGQQDPFRPDNETLLPTAGQTYTVVGIYRRPAFEMRTAPGYTLITRAAAPSAGHTAVVTLRDPFQARSFAKKSLDGYSYAQNDNVLRFTGASDDTLFNTLLYSAGSVLLLLIMTGSVFMIYNSFSISLSERTHQFGILMSVGATEKQLRSSVLFEGFCIGALGIPLGILAAIPSVKAVLALTAQNFANVMYSSATLELVISVPALIAAALISLATILISAYIPAKKAASVPVMECIRQTNEIKTDAKALRTPKHAVSLWGLEGTLAIKNFRRNKARYRSIILSLTFSVVLFVAASYFKACLVSISGQAKVVTDFDISLGVPTDTDDTRLAQIFEQAKTAPGITHASCRLMAECTGTVRTDSLSDTYWQSAGPKTAGETTDLTATLLIVSDDFYRQCVEELGLSAEEYTGPDGKFLTVGKMESSGYVEGPSDLPDLFTGSGLRITLTPWDSEGQPIGSGTDVMLGIQTFVPPDSASITGNITDVPYFFDILAPWSMRDVLLPEGAAVLGKGIAFRSDTPGQTTNALKALIVETAPNATLYNMHHMLEESRNILFIADLFTLVFVSMISLIAAANVFNTISTNIRLRRRELAMLRSVGMADGSFGRMMRFECVLYGLRTLLFGLPLSLLVSWLIYTGMTWGETDVFPFRYPWASLGVSMLGVFLVISVTMLCAVRRLRKENIIDALRDELS